MVIVLTCTLSHLQKKNHKKKSLGRQMQKDLLKILRCLHSLTLSNNMLCKLPLANTVLITTVLNVTVKFPSQQSQNIYLGLLPGQKDSLDFEETMIELHHQGRGMATLHLEVQLAESSCPRTAYYDVQPNEIRNNKSKI